MERVVQISVEMPHFGLFPAMGTAVAPWTLSWPLPTVAADIKSVIRVADRDNYARMTRRLASQLF